MKVQTKFQSLWSVIAQEKVDRHTHTHRAHGWGCWCRWAKLLEFILQNQWRSNNDERLRHHHTELLMQLCSVETSLVIFFFIRYPHVHGI